MTQGIMAIQEYDFVVKYCKATENRVVDILSLYAMVEKEEHTHKNADIKIVAMKYEVPQELKQKFLWNLGADHDQDYCIVSRKDSLHPRYKAVAWRPCKQSW